MCGFDAIKSHMRGFVLGIVLALAAGQGLAMAKQRHLSGAELKKLRGVYHVIWKDKHEAKVQLHADGRIVARSGSKVDTGRWKVKGNALCVAFRTWTHGRFRCGLVARTGDGWFVGMFRDNGEPRLRFRR